FFVYGAIRPVASVTMQVFRATGRTQPVFRIAVLNLAAVSFAVFVGLSYGPTWVAALISSLSVPVILYGFTLVAAALELRTALIVRACAPAVVACAVAMAVTLVARSSLDTIGLLPLRLGAGLAVLGTVYVPALLFVDRRSVDEIRALL